MMTIYEFDVHYDKLIDHRPRYYNKTENRQAIFAAVKDMELLWFKQAVDKVVAHKEFHINIIQEAKQYRWFQRKHAETRHWLHEQENKSAESTMGLQDYLTSIGAKCPLDAIEKVKELKKLSGGSDVKEDEKLS